MVGAVPVVVVTVGELVVSVFNVVFWFGKLNAVGIFVDEYAVVVLLI